MESIKVNTFITLCALTIFSIAGRAFATDAGGGLPGYYLARGLGARALGLGGAYVGLADGADAVYWNPAGLGRIKKWEVQGMHSVLYEDTRYQTLSLAGKIPFTTDSMFGLGYMQLSSDDFIRRDANNNPAGGFSSVDQSILIGIAKPLPYGVSIGGSVRLRRASVDDYSGSAWDVDGGIMWRPDLSKKPSFERFILSAGAVVRNISGAEMKRADISEGAPRIVSAGGALGYSFGPKISVTVTADMENSAGGASRRRLGTEIGFLKDAGFLRGGVDGSDPAFGGGMRLGPFTFDYALLNHKELGANHNLSLAYKFGDIKVFQERCASQDCLNMYNRVSSVLENYETGGGRNLKECDKAMKQLDSYLKRHPEEADAFAPLMDKYGKFASASLENALIVCKLSSDDVPAGAEWDTDLYEAFTTYIARKSGAMRVVGDFDCGNRDEMGRIRDKSRKSIIVNPQLLRVKDRYTLRTKVTNAAGESRKLEVPITEIYKGMDFRKYADQLVDKFDELDFVK